MINKKYIPFIKPLFLLVLAILFSSVLFAQAELEADSTQQAEPEQEKKVKKKRDSFKVYAGLNFNALNVASDKYDSEMYSGFTLGGSYKRGKFFYWEIGARYSNNGYKLVNLSPSVDSTESTGTTFSVSAIEVPITGGINLTSFVDRLVGVRIFISAVPSFGIAVSDNDAGVTKDHLNSFNFLGQVGVGLDVAFLFLEGGFNYGMNDLFQNDIQSNPIQAYVLLGFRF